MNKLTKIGLSALCGSLASVSLAQAGEYSVTGAVTASHANQDSDETTGNPLGMSRNMTLNASGELDNGYSWTYFAATNDFNDSGFNMTSAGVALNMDALGTIELRQKASPVGARDDKTPNAYEESWDGISGGLDLAAGIGGGAASHIAWVSGADLPMGIGLELAYAPGAIGGDATADKGSSGGNNTTNGGFEVVVTASPMDNLALVVGYAQKDHNTTAYEDDHHEAIAHITYTAGGATLHYQQSVEATGISGTAAATSTEYYDTRAYGISFAVNDNLSISATTVENEKQRNTGSDVSQDFTGLGVAYNLGGATLKIYHNEVDNKSFSTGSAGDDEKTVVALGLAF